MISLILSKINLVLAEIPLLLRIPMLVGALWAAVVWWYNNCAFGKYDLAALKKIPGPELEPVIGNMRMFAVPVTKVLSVFKRGTFITTGDFWAGTVFIKMTPSTQR